MILCMCLIKDTWTLKVTPSSKLPNRLPYGPMLASRPLEHWYHSGAAQFPNPNTVLDTHTVQVKCLQTLRRQTSTWTDAEFSSYRLRH